MFWSSPFELQIHRSPAVYFVGIFGELETTITACPFIIESIFLFLVFLSNFQSKYFDNFDKIRNEVDPGPIIETSKAKNKTEPTQNARNRLARQTLKYEMDVYFMARALFHNRISKLN